MQISSFRQNAYWPRPAVQTSPSNASFEQALGGLGTEDSRKETKALSIDISPTASLNPSNASADASKPDFTSMTPKDFSNAAKGMYDRGEIDLDQLFKMKFAAGTMSEGTPYAAVANSQPVNYVKYFQDQLSMGPSLFGQYGSEKIADIVNILTR